MSTSDVLVAVGLVYALSTFSMVFSYYASGGGVWRINSLPLLILLGPLILALSIIGVAAFIVGALVWLILLFISAVILEPSGAKAAALLLALFGMKNDEWTLTK